MERRLRLRRETEVREVRARGKAFAEGPLVVRILPNQTDPPQNRYAVIAGKRVGKAVQRNRAKRLVREALIRHVDVRQTWDHKSRLQELLQERYRVTPTYRILEETGPAHDRRFVAEVRLHDRVLGRGVGRSKKAAEQAAAAAALAQPEFARAGARSSDASRSE